MTMLYRRHIALREAKAEQARIAARVENEITAAQTREADALASAARAQDVQDSDDEITRDPQATAEDANARKRKHRR